MTTEVSAEPVFIPGLYTVVFDRIGRTRSPAPLTAHADSGSDLAEAIYKYSGRFLNSKGYDVDVRFDGTGFVSAGFRPAGDFTWKLADAAVSA